MNMSSASAPALPAPGAPALALGLQPAQFLRVPDPSGLCLQGVSGTLWITVDGRPADVELGPGERLCFDRDTAPVLIGTLGGPAEFRASRPDGVASLALAWA